MHCQMLLAVLCAGAPDIAPFLADESAAAVPDLGRVDYTLPYYLQYAKRVCDKARELSNEGYLYCLTPSLCVLPCVFPDPDYGWNAHKVELSLWTVKTAEQIGFGLKEHQVKVKERRKRKQKDGVSATKAKRQLVS